MHLRDRRPARLQRAVHRTWPPAGCSPSLRRSRCSPSARRRQARWPARTRARWRWMSRSTGRIRGPRFRTASSACPSRLRRSPSLAVRRSAGTSSGSCARSGPGCSVSAGSPPTTPRGPTPKPRGRRGPRSRSGRRDARDRGARPPNRVAGAPDGRPRSLRTRAAAREVAVASRALGSNLEAVEIGNEPTPTPSTACANCPGSQGNQEQVSDFARRSAALTPNVPMPVLMCRLGDIQANGRSGGARRRVPASRC